MKPVILALIAGLLVFFYPLLLKGQLPFPGHLLVSFFSPFNEITWTGSPTGVPRQDLLGFDTVRMMYPWQAFTTAELQAGRLPLWNPDSFAGARAQLRQPDPCRRRTLRLRSGWVPVHRDGWGGG